MTALRAALAAVVEFLAWARLAQTWLSIRYYEADIARSRRGLDKALQAYARARADVLEHELRGATEPAMPEFLTKRAPVRRVALKSRTA